MLILERHVGEEIVIGNGITIMVTAIRGDRVALGITAPRTVPVFRKELPTAGEKERET